MLDYTIIYTFHNSRTDHLLQIFYIYNLSEGAARQSRHAGQILWKVRRETAAVLPPRLPSSTQEKQEAAGRMENGAARAI